jgi:hypothetical protein
MGLTSGKLTTSVHRNGNVFQRNFNLNTSSLTGKPAASFSGGVSLARRMVQHQTSLLQPVATDVAASSAMMALTPNDDPAPNPIASSGPDVDISTSPPVVSAAGTLSSTTSTPGQMNWTPFILALVVLVLVVKL